MPFLAQPTTTIMASSVAPQRQRCAKCGTIGDGVVCGRGTCRAVTYCSVACKHAHAAIHARMCLQTTLSSRDCLVRESRPLASSFHPINDYFQQSMITNRADIRPAVCPCTAIMGVPLILAVMGSSHEYALPLNSGTLLTDLLMMDPDTGYLSKSGALAWQATRYQDRTLGIYREDGKPLTHETLETILEFLLMVLEEMSGMSRLDGRFPCANISHRQHSRYSRHGTSRSSARKGEMASMARSLRCDDHVYVMWSRYI